MLPDNPAAMTKLSKRSKQSFYEKEGFMVMLARRLRTNVRLKIDLPKELSGLLNKKTDSHLPS